ncbi:hypothetical protein LTR04_001203 [Oleoguttula sp. CCFEE 6159]|nr:hypothetical protein LTR04_001203 [Oleoguttula sp. CCFEE 6159]
MSITVPANDPAELEQGWSIRHRVDNASVRAPGGEVELVQELHAAGTTPARTPAVLKTQSPGSLLMSGGVHLPVRLCVGLVDQDGPKLFAN